MNDELSGQLTPSDWRIPTYAQGILWLETDAETVPAEGEHGLFELTTPARRLTLRYGAAAGTVLTQLHWQPDTLEWRGEARLGGYVDAIHSAEASALPVVVVSVGAQPLYPNVSPYPDASKRTTTPYPVPDFFAGVDDAVEETFSTWLLPDDSPLVGTAENALLNKLPVHLYGRLAGAGGAWEEHFALPLLLESMTLFSP